MVANLEYYKAFYFVAKTGSFTIAAKELSVSQSAVSQAVKQLETALNTTLFRRIAKGVALTKEGELLFSYVAKGYEQIEAGEKKLEQMLNLELGEIRIGASDMTLRFYLLPFLEKFHEQFPKIKVTVTNGPTPETLKFLKEGKIDFGVVSTPFAKTDGIEVTRVKEISDIFVAGRKFISYKNKMLDFKDLEQLPLIFLEGTTSTRSYMDGFLKENGVMLNPEFELATSDMIVQFAMRNLGVGCVVKEFAKEQLETGKLFELRFNKMIPKRHFCVVTDKRSSLSEAAMEMMRILENESSKNVGNEIYL